MKRTSKELKRIARDMINNRYSIPMGAFVIASLIPAVIEIPFSLSSGEYPTMAQRIIILLAEYLILLISQVLGTGVAYVHLNMTRNRKFKLIDVFWPFRSGAERFFGASVLLSLLAVSGCLPLVVGIIYFYFAELSVVSVTILILTGIVTVVLCAAIILNYNFITYFLLDYPQMKVTAAFQECRLMMKGNKKRLLYILLSFLGWDILILCSLGIASLWVNPYMTQTMVTFYLDCTGELDRIPVRNYSVESSGSSNPIF